VIQFEKASKTYRSLFGRSVNAVSDFSLEIAEGEIMGIAGPNGAGKSTLIAMLLGYQYPTHGRVRIHGTAPRKYVEQHGIGYVSELINIPPRWRTIDALRRFAMLAGISGKELNTRVEALIEQLGLQEHRDKKVKALSKGSAQRVGLAQALLRDDRIVVFDEPTHGLDPVWTQRFREIVQAMRRPDRSILIASHNLDELQRLSDRVAIIDHGQLQRLVATGYSRMPDNGTTYRLQIVEGVEHVRLVFGDSAVEVGGGEFDVTPSDVTQLNRGLAELIQRGALVVQVAPARTTLEEQFRGAVSDAGGYLGERS
jgi:ABC-2 type transport system ATP-binding protein